MSRFSSLGGVRFLATSFLAACGPSEGDQVDLPDVCGEEGPAQILELDDDEAVAPWVGPPMLRLDDRWLVAVQRFDRDVVDVDEARAGGPYRVVPLLDARVESMDLCGNDRRVVAEDIDWMMPPSVEGRPWLGTAAETDMLYVFDPAGSFEAQPLAEGRLVTWTNADPPTAVVRRNEQRDIVLYAIDGDAIESRVVATSVAQVPTFAKDPASSVRVLHDDGTLVDLDLSTGDEEPLVQGARSFTEDDGGRFIAWAHGDPATPPGELPTAMTLYDRTTGASRALAAGVPLFGQILGNVVVVQTYPESGDVSTTFVLLPGEETLTLEGLWYAFGFYCCNRVVVYSGEPRSSWPPEMFVYTPSNGVLERAAGPVPAISGTHDALWSPDNSPYTDEEPAPWSTPYDLLRFSLEDLTTEIVARRVRSDLELPDDRWIAVQRPDDGPVGNLVILDGEDGSASTIDREVSNVVGAVEPDDRRFPFPRRADAIVYQVRDPGSGRTGLWRADF